MSKIEKLTEEQTKLMEVYKDKWIKIGLSTEPTNRERAALNVPAYYEVAGLKPPEAVAFAKSPKSAMVILTILNSKSFIEEVKNTAILANVSLQTLIDAVISTVDKNTFNVDPSVLSSVATLINSNQEPVKWFSEFSGGNLWPGWQSFYDYFDQVLNIPGVEKIRPTVALSQDVGWIFPYDKLCLMVEKPLAINLNARGQLHNEHGKSIEWSDGYGIYSLRGVTVPEFLFTTPKDQVDVSKVLQLPTEQRMAAMQFIGLEKFLSALNAEEIDKQGDYVLYYLTVENVKIGPYLSMVCPSSGRRFLEGVGDEQKYENIDPTIKTVTAALFERASRASKRLMKTYSDKLQYHA